MGQNNKKLTADERMEALRRADEMMNAASMILAIDTGRAKQARVAESIYNLTLNNAMLLVALEDVKNGETTPVEVVIDLWYKALMQNEYSILTDRVASIIAVDSGADVEVKKTYNTGGKKKNNGRK